ncbi:nucleotidyltransferase domain-containing protein [Kitasatospora sp. NPDC058965]|uniref:nucleotidyltransferase domain-containing protein n=1 Tax=Kitasatospora sp. NPDC058965 TaxID=3346682 RepID=UPI0036BE31CF
MDHDLIDQARRLAAARFPDALAVVLGGSAAAGRATASSDLDLAVLVPDGGESLRETVRFEGRLAELFVHTRAGLAEIFAADVASRRAVMQSIYADGLALHDPSGDGAAARDRAAADLLAGPPALGADAVEAKRYGLTDLLLDLADRQDPDEALAIGAAALGTATELLCDHHRAWVGGGKWLPRRLRAADPELGGALLAGHRRLCASGEPDRLVAAAGQVLGLVGGPLAEGYRRTW